LLAIATEVHTREATIGRKLVFENARKLADETILEYLNLSDEENNKFAEMGEKYREWFESESLCLYNMARAKNSQKFTHSKLFFDIVTNPKKIPVLKKYIEHLQKHPTSKNRGIYHYLRTYNIYGNKVEKPGSPQSAIKIYQYDFITQQTFQKSKKKKGGKNLIKSLTHRINPELKEQFLDAITLKEARTQIIKNYIQHIQKQENPKPQDIKLVKYLYEHDINGNKVEKPGSPQSAYGFHSYDSTTQQYFKTAKKKMSRENLIKSLTYRIDPELKEQFLDTLTLKKARTQIITHYTQYIKNIENPTPQDTSLLKYLREHDINGNKVEKPGSPQSALVIYHYDFTIQKSFGKAKKKMGGENLIKSLTHRVDPELKEQFLDALTLKEARTQTIQNYIKHTKKNPKPKTARIYGYLITHDINGNKVEKPRSQQSAVAIYNYDSTTQQDFRTAKKKMGGKNLFLSLTHRLDSKLVKQFEEVYWKYNK